MRLSRCTRTMLGSVVFALAGCAERQLEPDIPGYRVDACEIWCEAVLDPVCGSETVEIQDEEECVDHCIQDEPGHWRPDSDGKDQCSTEYIGYIECVGNLVCEQRQEHFGGLIGDLDPMLPCYEELQVVFACSRNVNPD